MLMRYLKLLPSFCARTRTSILCHYSQGACAMANIVQLA